MVREAKTVSSSPPSALMAFKDGDDLPTLMYIHGVEFSLGSSSDAASNGSFLVQRSVELGKPMVSSALCS